jgi:hypothetical protein
MEDRNVAAVVVAAFRCRGLRAGTGLLGYPAQHPQRQSGRDSYMP